MAWEMQAGIGIAGNIAGHLEQAHEAADFKQIQAAEGAPKGIFPFWMPGLGTFLDINPVSSTELRLPDLETHVQTEPEVSLACDLGWQGDAVTSLTPRFAAAFDDCSLRRPGVPKISLKKNWGPGSKGMAAHWIPLDGFAPSGTLDTWRLASFVLREGELHAYGIDSPVAGYSYFHQQLLDWLLDKLNSQRDEGPLEDIHGMLCKIGRPQRLVITIGATRYTDFGTPGWLLPGDRDIVCLYHPDQGKAEDLIRTFLAGREVPASVLAREVVG